MQYSARSVRCLSPQVIELKLLCLKLLLALLEGVQSETNPNPNPYPNPNPNP